MNRKHKICWRLKIYPCILILHITSEVGAPGEDGEQLNKSNKQINKHDRKASMEER